MVLIFLDHNYSLQPVRYVLGYIGTPLFIVADAPAQLSLSVGSSFESRKSLQKENDRLRTQERLLLRRIQKLAALEAENERLRGLLNSSAMVDDSVLAAEIIGVDSDPFRHEVILDKGARDGAYEGQPILDADGLMGQLTEVGPFSSRALLITDSSHGIPVHVNRSGVRAVVVGAGELDRMHLMHVPDTADIQVGDLLVSSGLGGRFPKGYPVGTVTIVRHDPGASFAIVEAVPLAHLDRTRHVLLVFTGGSDKPS